MEIECIIEAWLAVHPNHFHPETLVCVIFYLDEGLSIDEALSKTEEILPWRDWDIRRAE